MGEGKQGGAGRSQSERRSDKPVKTDGSLGNAEFTRLKRPVSADGFLVDRPLSPEEEGLAGPLPDRDRKPKKSPRK